MRSATGVRSAWWPRSPPPPGSGSSSTCHHVDSPGRRRYARRSARGSTPRCARTLRAADFTAAYRRDSSPVLTCPHAEKTAISAMSTDVVDSTFHFAMRADRERLARFLLDDWDAADRSSLAAP